MVAELICVQTGACQMTSRRDCPIQSRVIANFFAGRPPAEWGEELLRRTTVKGGRADGFRTTEHVDKIEKEELICPPESPCSSEYWSSR